LAYEVSAALSEPAGPVAGLGAGAPAPPVAGAGRVSALAVLSAVCREDV
jgi:hypothetical protein